MVDSSRVCFYILGLTKLLVKETYSTDVSFLKPKTS